MVRVILSLLSRSFMFNWQCHINILFITLLLINSIKPLIMFYEFKKRKTVNTLHPSSNLTDYLEHSVVCPKCHMLTLEIGNHLSYETIGVVSSSRIFTRCISYSKFLSIFLNSHISPSIPPKSSNQRYGGCFQQRRNHRRG